MEYDYIISKPPLDEDTLTHYGVLGMRWGVRRDIKKTGSISKKTKKKISDAMSKASYGKTKRMLNASDQIRADYEGDKLYYKNKKKKTLKTQAKAKKAESAAKQAKDITKSISNSAKSKGYKYETRDVDRLTNRAINNFAIGNAIGPYGGIISGAVTEVKSRKYKKKNKSENSPYSVRGTAYKKSYR